MGGGFGGISNLEKKRHYRAAENQKEDRDRRSGGYGMVFDKDEIRNGRKGASSRDGVKRYQERSRSPYERDRYRERSPSYRDQGRRRGADGGIPYDAYEQKSRRRQ